LKSKNWEILIEHRPADPALRNVDLSVCTHLFVDFLALGPSIKIPLLPHNPHQESHRPLLIALINFEHPVLTRALTQDHSLLAAIPVWADQRLITAALPLLELGEPYFPAHHTNALDKQETSSDRHSHLSDVLFGLTPREAVIWLGISRGFSNKEVSRRHDISEATVKMHARHLFEKLHVGSRVEASNLFRELINEP